MPAFQELMKQIDDLNEKASTLTASWGDGMPSRAQMDEVKGINRQIGELEKQAADSKEGDALRAEIADRKRRMDQPVTRIPYAADDNPADGGNKSHPTLKRGQTWGDYFTENDVIKGWQKELMPHNAAPNEKRRVQSPVLEMPGFGRKDLVTGLSDTSAGALVRPDYLPFVGMPVRPLTLRDIISTGTTSSDSLQYPYMTGFTNNAASVAEATAAGGSSGVKPESAVALDLRTATVKTIAHWIPVSKRALADAPYIRTLIDQFLMYGLDEEEEDQVAQGDNTGENLDGIFHVTGTTSQAWDTDLFTTTRKALTKAKVVARAARVNAWLMNPYTVEALDLLTNNEKNFYMGGPTLMGNQRLWGLPIVESEAVPVGYAAVGDFKSVLLLDREQSTIQMTDSHADFFIRNLLAILAEKRVALMYLRPAALVITDVAA
jgi:HK97 family phage major capsid protein